MIFIYKFTILVLLIKIITCAKYGCPSFYSSDGVSQAIMEVPTPSTHTNVIKFHVQFSIGDSISTEKLNNKLSFLGTPEDVLNKQQLVFKLELPAEWNYFEKKITKITVDDEVFCSSDGLNAKDFPTVATINMSISLKITTYVISSSDNTESAPTASPKITPQPNIINHIPTETKPINQNFQSKYCHEGSHSKFLIAGGAEVKRDMYPWIGALVTKIGYNVEFQCGSTLITEKLVLTAAHCIELNLGKELLLIFGTTDIDDRYTDQVQIANVIAYKIHPDYVNISADADIAILELSKNLDLTRSVFPICLCNFQDSFKKFVLQKGVVAGWGRNEHNKLSKHLKQIYTGIVTQEDCLWSSSSFLDITSDRTFCAGDKNGSGPCNGDSGSGFYFYVEGRWVIRGIVSRSLQSTDGRCDLDQYIVYVDVAKHLNWIETCIKTNSVCH